MGADAMVTDVQLHQLTGLGNQKATSDADQSRNVGEHSFLPDSVACFCRSS